MPSETSRPQHGGKIDVHLSGQIEKVLLDRLKKKVAQT